LSTLLYISGILVPSSPSGVWSSQNHPKYTNAKYFCGFEIRFFPIVKYQSIYLISILFCTWQMLDDDLQIFAEQIPAEAPEASK
jgi:hypothetical protein